MSDKGSMKITGFGKFLRRTREKGEESREKVFEATRISVKMIRALEEEDFSVLPADVYVRGFLRTLAVHFQIDKKEILDRFDNLKHRIAHGPTSAVDDVDSPEEEVSPWGANLAQRVDQETAVKAWFAAAQRKSNEQRVRMGREREKSLRPQKASKRLENMGGGSRRVNLGLVLLLLIVAITLTLSYMLNRSPSSEQQGETPAASETSTRYDWKG